MFISSINNMNKNIFSIENNEYINKGTLLTKDFVGAFIHIRQKYTSCSFITIHPFREGKGIGLPLFIINKLYISLSARFVWLIYIQKMFFVHINNSRVNINT
jgi:hypothetical protein